MDKLEELIKMQTVLNDHIFKKKDIRTKEGKLLTMADFNTEISQGSMGPNSIVNHWLRNFLEALNDESRELSEELLWKWWSKDALDLQNIRVEIIDQLHFWLVFSISVRA